LGHRCNAERKSENKKTKWAKNFELHFILDLETRDIQIYRTNRLFMGFSFKILDAYLIGDFREILNLN
jgi:hypothetical protein